MLGLQNKIRMNAYAFLCLSLWVLVSATYRRKPFGFVCSILNDKRLTMTFIRYLTETVTF
jgi:hypothetical protein